MFPVSTYYIDVIPCDGWLQCEWVSAAELAGSAGGHQQDDPVSVRLHPDQVDQELYPTGRLYPGGGALWGGPSCQWGTFRDN